MKRRIKSFTLFLFFLIIIYLILGTKVFLIDTNTDEKYQDKGTGQTPTWTGIITLWDIPYVEIGTGSNSSWLNARIEAFERQNPGVFIDVRKMTPERVEMYFTGSLDKTILPDIISIPPYDDFVPPSLYQNLEGTFEERDLDRITPLARESVQRGDEIQGVPVMMGTYALFVNKDMLEEREVILGDSPEINYRILDSIMEKLPYVEKERKKEVHYYGFGSYNSTYSKPIVSMIYNEGGKIQEDFGYKYIYSWLQNPNLAPEGIGNTDSATAVKLFVDQKRVGVFLGNTRALYRVRSFQSQGKGFDLGVFNLPIEGKEALFQDQIASYGLIKKEDGEKKEYCIAFLRSLLSDTAQTDLKRIGMFPIVNGIGYIYDDDPEMLMLEENIGKYSFGPNDKFWLANRHEIIKILDVNRDSDLNISE